MINDFRVLSLEGGEKGVTENAYHIIDRHKSLKHIGQSPKNPLKDHASIMCVLG